MSQLIQLQARHSAAKHGKTGTDVPCAMCGKTFKKASYQQAFCSNSGAGNCKDAFWAQVRGAEHKAIEPLPPIMPPADAPDETGRTLKDYALEHAEYMATAATALINDMNQLATLQECDVLEGVTPEDREDIINGAQGDVSEAVSRLQSYIHEFRKRHARYLAGK